MAKSNKQTAEDLNKMGLYEIEPGIFKKVSGPGEFNPKKERISNPFPDNRKLMMLFAQKESTKVNEQVSIISGSVLFIPGIIPGLNGKDGLMRSHWSTIKKQKKLYCAIILQHLRENKVKKHKGSVTVQYIGYKTQMMDWDNFCSSFKHIGDSLQKMKVITGDSPKIITQFIPQQIKCKRSEDKVIVIIKDV